jgi:16S rRNA (cytosine967-C5)-methyltransferase
MSPKSNRLLALEILQNMLSGKGTLSSQLNNIALEFPDANLPLIQEYTYGVCRWFHRLDVILASLMDKPLRKKDQDIHCLLLLGLYQLYYMRTPDHASINETVAATRHLRKDWASKLVNAVLRNAQRKQEALEADSAVPTIAGYSHPDWMITALKEDWPDQWEDILIQNNIQAPMTLRVNTRCIDRESYLAQLVKAGIAAKPGNISTTAIILDQPVDVDQLPGFPEGHVSVQDESSQIAAAMLAPEPNSRCLDACAAPGGKTCALLENQPDNLELLALDSSNSRLEKVRENLARLQLQATTFCGNAQDTSLWWDGKPFNSILLDAPCTGTGVIRRHPDIKLLRQAKDVSRLASIQQQLLIALWPCLKPGGRLLYSTCSVLKAENSVQIEAFLASTKDAKHVDITLPGAIPCHTGLQFLPGQDNLDGFYYALLEKV